MPQPEDPPKEAAKKERYKYGTDQLMNQFLKMESGGLGKFAEYRRGHEWTFVWCSEDPAKALPAAVKAVQELMNDGMPFEEAFACVEGSFAHCEHTKDMLDVPNRRCLFCGESFYDSGH
jgi:hypothetical protein